MDQVNEIVNSLVLEMRRGMIVLGVLSQLEKPEYGYSLVQNMCDKGIAVDSGTLYPLLRRLEKQGILLSEWETEGTKPRKYYRRTEKGNQVYEELSRQWKQMTESMDQLL